jgi:hypothetical protein
MRAVVQSGVINKVQLGSSNTAAALRDRAADLQI